MEQSAESSENGGTERETLNDIAEELSKSGLERLAQRIKEAGRRLSESALLAVGDAARFSENLGQRGSNICKTEKKSPKSIIGGSGMWTNGDDFEYDFAYCSKCGRMEYTGWDTHEEAKDSIGHFHKEYRYCPGCGAKMEGGLYYVGKSKEVSVHE